MKELKKTAFTSKLIYKGLILMNILTNAYPEKSLGVIQTDCKKQIVI